MSTWGKSMTDDPWAGLAYGGIDARRVTPSGQQDFFWVLSGDSEPGLLLRLAGDTEEVAPLPKLRNLDLGYRHIAGKRSLLLVLRDPEQRELFASLCRDIVRAGETAVDNADALRRCIRRTMRWYHLLRGGRNSVLSLEEQRGLIGELRFLTHLIDLVGPRAAIEAWKGPFGSSKDFELGACLIEVKARRGASKPHVQISSEDQLADVPDCRLFLLVSPVDAVIKPHGMTLSDQVDELDQLFSVAEPESCELWEEAIVATGFDFDDDYSDRRWIIGKPHFYEVVQGFPRVTPPIPQGVSAIRYSIGLDACAPFYIETDHVDGLIRKV